MVRSVVARRKAGLAALAALVSISPVLAQDDCAAPIQSLAETVLEGRAQLAALPARRFGTRALYLLIQYGGLDEATVRQKLTEAIDARIQGADDLAFAWSVHADGLEPTLAALGSDAVAAVVDTSRASSVRTLLTSGAADGVMAAMAAMPPPDMADLSQLVIAVTFDLPDAQKAEIETLASEHRLDSLAAGLAASQLDPEAWSRHVAGMDAEEVDKMASSWGWLPTLNGNPQVLSSTNERSEYADASREAMRLVTWASARQPEITLMNSYTNMTGELDLAAAVSKSVLKKFENGSLSEKRNLDDGWLATLRAFATAGLDANGVASAFSGLSLGTNRVDRDTVVEVMNWIAAVDALTPYLRGTADQPPGRPETLSDGFSDWERWTALAKALREAPEATLAAAAAEDLPILAELLLAADQRTELARLLETAPVTLDTMTMANDFLGRIDRLCDARLWHKGEAPLLAGRALYKFDEAQD